MAKAKKQNIIPKKPLIGLVDADLLDNGTRHPNLALLKLAGYFRDRGDVDYELIINEDVDISKYKRIYLSRVFSFTNLPAFYEKYPYKSRKFRCGGTGFYMQDNSKADFDDARAEDLCRLENDKELPGLDMKSQMPDYNLYDKYIEKQVERGIKIDRYKDYQYYSIGFLTRGCFRHCSFCVNVNESRVHPYSKLTDFYDESRPYIYLWDDNFFAAPYKVWKSALEELMAKGKPFQFRQGLDERMLAQSPHGEEMAEMLSRSKYHGDFIFAFDNWSDRPIIEKALKIWKKYNPNKGTKFYLFCGYRQSKNNLDAFYQDIWELFQRIRVLMQYKCVGYVMRHEDYHQAPVENFYVQVARWCNQQQFYKKMSFWEFAYRNQSYWEEHSKGITDRPQLKTFEEFEEDLKNGYYGDGQGQMKMCLPLQSVMKTLKKFPEHREELLEMFNYKMANLINPQLWEE